MGTNLCSGGQCKGRTYVKTETPIYGGVRPWSSSSTRLGSTTTLLLHLRAADQRRRIQAWVASGAGGQPVVVTEAAVKAHVPGLQDSINDTAPLCGDGLHLGVDARKRQANRDRRSARKKRHIADMEGLRSYRQGNTGIKNPSQQTGGKDSGGKGEGKSKDQAGQALCFSWALGTGICGKLPPGAECQGPIKRAHKCRTCLSPISPGLHQVTVFIFPQKMFA